MYNHKKSSQNYDEMKSLIARSKQTLNEDTKRILSPQEKETEEAKFKEAVTESTTFGQLVINTDNVTWYGELIREKIKWFYSLETTNGCYITCENAQISEDSLQIIKNLAVYYNQWAANWGSQVGK